jgi:hypothetical protein
MPYGIPKGAMCVQRFDDSLNSAIHTTYRISLRSSSMPEPRDPLLKVLIRLFISDRHCHYKKRFCGCPHWRADPPRKREYTYTRGQGVGYRISCRDTPQARRYRAQVASRRKVFQQMLTKWLLGTPSKRHWLAPGMSAGAAV